MSYRQGGKKKASKCATNGNRAKRPVHQELAAKQVIAPSKENRPRSTRSLRREALRSATAARVKAEKSILAGRGLSNKHISDTTRNKLFKDLKSVYAIAYKRNPELFQWDML